jgi:glutamine amidotransferase
MFVHNGLIYGYAGMRRDLILHVEPELFSEIRGSADSELMFFLALSYGLEKDPIGAMEKTVGLIEEIGRAQGVEHPMQMTVGVANGETLWAFRYSTQGDSRTLFYNTAVAQLRELYPDHPRLHLVQDDARAICSEPLSDLSGVWNVVPESTALVVKNGEIELKPFAPSPP